MCGDQENLRENSRHTAQRPDVCFVAVASFLKNFRCDIIWRTADGPTKKNINVFNKFNLNINKNES